MFNPEPVVLTREQHISEIMSHWRMKRIDRIRDEVIFEEDERAIRRAMHEPDPEPIDKAVAAIWSGYGLFLLLGGLWIWECIR